MNWGRDMTTPEALTEAILASEDPARPGAKIGSGLTEDALQAGLAVLGRKLARPGRRVVFKSGPRHNVAGNVLAGQIVGSLAAPQDAYAA